MEDKSENKYEAPQKYNFKVGPIKNTQREIEMIGSLQINQGQMTLRFSNDLHDALEIDLVKMPHY